MANDLDKVQPPALPLAPNTITPSFIDQLNNIFRLFFNRTTALINAVFSIDSGGKFLYFPYGMFYSDADQTAAVINTGYPVTFNTTDTSNDVSIVSNSRITPAVVGTYRFSVTLQVESASAGSKTFWVWPSVSGSAKTNQARVVTVSGSGENFVGVLDFVISLAAGEYVEINWATSDTNLSLQATSTTTPHPGIASATVAVSFVSNS